jgi:hypothetical protein
MKKAIQEIIIQQIYDLLKQSSAEVRKTKMFKILLYHLVRWYPQVTFEGEDVYASSININTQNLPRTLRSNRIINNILESQAKDSEKRKQFKEHTHHEHNPPVHVKASELLNLSDESLTLDSVRNSLNDKYDVILITQEEKKVLNGKINTLYSLDGEQKNGCGFSKSGNYSERLEAINAVLINN